MGESPTARSDLIDEAPRSEPHLRRSTRVHRFKRGSGLPVRYPGDRRWSDRAAAGSIASVDALRAHRPRTRGAPAPSPAPGPCYGRGGGKRPTVTDAEPLSWAASTPIASRAARGSRLGRARRPTGASPPTPLGAPLALEPALAAFGVAEIVDENMAKRRARRTAIEWGKKGDVARRTMIAFGGAAAAARRAPRREARLRCRGGAHRGRAWDRGDRLPARRPIGLRGVASRFKVGCTAFDADLANAILDGMQAEAPRCAAGARRGRTGAMSRARPF